MAETISNSEREKKGLIFGRETRIRKPAARRDDDREVFAVCLKTDDEDLLFPKKVYKIRMRGDRVLVIDEDGEPTIYPKVFFLVLALSPTAESTLAGVLG